MSSIYLEPDELEEHEREMEAKYIRAKKVEPRFELYRMEDAEIVGRWFRHCLPRSAFHGGCRPRRRPKAWIVPPHHVVAISCRATGERSCARGPGRVVELSNGQMVEDVRLALNGKTSVEFYGRVGGNVPTVEELFAHVMEDANVPA